VDLIARVSGEPSHELLNKTFAYVVKGEVSVNPTGVNPTGQAETRNTHNTSRCRRRLHVSA